MIGMVLSSERCIRQRWVRAPAPGGGRLGCSPGRDGAGLLPLPTDDRANERAHVGGLARDGITAGVVRLDPRHAMAAGLAGFRPLLAGPDVAALVTPPRPLGDFDLPVAPLVERLHAGGGDALHAGDRAHERASFTATRSSQASSSTHQNSRSMFPEMNMSPCWPQYWQTPSPRCISTRCSNSASQSTNS